MCLCCACMLLYSVQLWSIACCSWHHFRFRQYLGGSRANTIFISIQMRSANGFCHCVSPFTGRSSSFDSIVPVFMLMVVTSATIDYRMIQRLHRFVFQSEMPGPMNSLFRSLPVLVFRRSPIVVHVAMISSSSPSDIFSLHRALWLIILPWSLWRQRALIVYYAAMALWFAVHR